MMWRGGGITGLLISTVEPSIWVSVGERGVSTPIRGGVEGDGGGGGKGLLINAFERSIWVSTRLMLGCCWVAVRPLFCCSAGLALLTAAEASRWARG